MIRFAPELAKGVASYPVTSETVVVASYKLGEQTVEGKYDFEDIGKDVLKTATLGRYSLPKQIGYGMVIDYIYEVNKINSTDEVYKSGAYWIWCREFSFRRN